MAGGANTKVSLAPGILADDAQWKRTIQQWQQEVNQGHIQNVSSVTLVAGGTTTVVTDFRVGIASFIGFMPTTANAAAEIGAGGMYVSSRGKQTFTITHANNAQTDRTFTYCVLG